MVKYVEEDFVQYNIAIPEWDGNRDHYDPETGYGNRIPTHRVVKFNDGNLFRVYAICISNAASHFIIRDGTRQFFHDWQLI